MATIRARRHDAQSILPLDLRFHEMTQEEIEQNALDDPDNPPSTEEELQRGVAGRYIRRTRESTGLTQEAFAARFQVNLARLREQGRHMPDSVALAYFQVIRSHARAVEKVLSKPRD